MAIRKRLKEPDPPQLKSHTRGKQLGAADQLTDELIDQFCELIRKGLPADGVCDYLSVNSGSFWRWTQFGNRYLDGKGEEQDLHRYGQFVLRVRRATAEYRLKLVKRLHRGNLEKAVLWKRDIAILERRDRKSWSKIDPAGGNDDQIDPDEKFL